MSNNYNDKIKFFKHAVNDMQLGIKKYHSMNIINSSEYNTCLDSLEKIINMLNTISNENLINDLQYINNSLSALIKNYGIYNFDNFLKICLTNEFGNKYLVGPTLNKKLQVISKYFHPVNYKILNWSDKANRCSKKLLVGEISKNKIIDERTIIEDTHQLECIDLTRTCIKFNLRVYGTKLVLHDIGNKKTLCINCLVDELIIDNIDELYITDRILDLKTYMIDNGKKKTDMYTEESWLNFFKNLTIKDYLIYNNEDMFDKYIFIMNQVTIIQNKTINSLVQEFIGSDLYNQRLLLIQLLLNNYKQEFQYLAYLLYDLLSVEVESSSDSTEQKILYDSLPLECKKCFKTAMYKTIEYTTNLSNFDNNKIPLEQQICLMKVGDNIKEKAMQKLKEIKSKSEDSGSKARQYLDGLLKIPFGIYKQEYILTKKTEINNLFTSLTEPIKVINVNEIENDLIKNFFDFLKELLNKEHYSSVEILNIVDTINENLDPIYSNIINHILNDPLTSKKKVLLHLLNSIVLICKKHMVSITKPASSNDNIGLIKKSIKEIIENNKNNVELIKDIFILIESVNSNPIYNYLINTDKVMQNIREKNYEVTEYICSFNSTLDNAVHGHQNAKKQIERIVGQWINGEKSGYCFGFEGPPGVGKCLAKNTPIMLSTGELKMVQHITLEDKLMGDDSTERNVLALGTGIEKMYKIQQTRGNDYIVNESHILSLKMTKTGNKEDKHQMILGRRYLKNDIVDICIKDYLRLPKYLQVCLKGYKVGLFFEEKELELDPYILGYWLGNGDSACLRITTIEKEVVDYFKEYSYNNILKVVEKKNKKNENSKIIYNITSEYKRDSSNKNKPLNYLKNHNLINNKHIPEIYKCNSRKNRLKLLAGLIDSHGYYNKVNNSLEIIQENKKLADDILFLVCSLGFSGKIKECEKYYIYKKRKKKEGQYQRIIISGGSSEEIPVLIERKKPREHKQIKEWLNTSIKIVPLEEDKYYGFQIDGNSRFLLGDFTVTHNTTLAKKGLANCLKDIDGESRPFSFIALGGSSNGSILDGHNYTYVGSTWGKIVDILIDKKTMNPIIFIDELDKVSRTEHGKEIIGILTHLIDTTQNDGFQDKYFSNIDLDLSKALFIFSYNDVELIDRVLLDRIHRIKFENLLLDDKIIITKDFLLPEFYKKFGIENVIKIGDDMVKYIIEKYTNEPGVRKLKEILFELISSINLDLLKRTKKYNIPVIITKEIIENILYERDNIRYLKINNYSKVGIVNGLWANAYGSSGILHIESKFFSTSTFFDLKLTGMQGDVMKESMAVAKTLAVSLLSHTQMKKLIKDFDDTKLQGIHIHVPEGATPKDGPSAGAAIALVIYSLLTNKKIKNNFAITGEINLQGSVTAIGGIDLKILGGIRAGVTCFLYPKDNAKDFKLFYEKHSDKLDNYDFFEIEHISDVIKYMIL
tara:strand:+ start:6668 stop:10993 length:4326 start_codon:yes stop_codon:yes gene_type:complete